MPIGKHLYKGLLAIKVVPFSFLTAPITFATWAMATLDIAGLIWNSPSAFQETLVTVLFGSAMVSISVVLDRKNYQQDFAFWGYIFGGLALWGGLTYYFFSCDGWDSTCVLYGPWRIAYGLISTGLMVVAVFLNRQVFVVYGGFGVAIYLFWIVDRLFSDSWAFPIVLTLVGLLIIYSGIKIQQWFHNSAATAELGSAATKKADDNDNEAQIMPQVMPYVPLPQQHVVQVGVPPQPFGYYFAPAASVDVKA